MGEYMVDEMQYGELLREAVKEAQAQAVINGTSEMTLDEINNIISEVRSENRGKK